MLSRKTSASVSLDGGLPISNNESRKSSAILNNPKIRNAGKNKYPASGSRLASENNGYDTSRSFSQNNEEPAGKGKGFSNFNVFQKSATARNDNYIEKEIDKFNMRYGSNSNTRKTSVMKKIRNFSSEVVDEINEKRIINKRLTVGNLFWGLLIFAVLFWLLIIRPISYLFGGGSLGNFENAKYMNQFTADDLFMTSQQSQVSKFENEKFSLRLPYLDTLHNNFFITGSPIIKNTKYVKLLEKGNIGKHSVLLSKNTLPSDFEIQLSISLEPGSYNLKKQVANKRPGDGFSIFFTQESDDFVTKYPTSHEERNRILEKTGVDTRNVDLMGIPKNLKSDNIVLDFFENGEVVNTGDNRWNGLKTPHLSCLSVSADGNEYNYLDDGLSIAHDMVSLDNSIFSDKGTLDFNPKKFKLRIIRISALLFKIDIDYSGTGTDWQQLMNFENLNSRSKLFESFVRGGSDLRFGISALNGEQTANFQINELRVYNYLWENPVDLVGNDGLKLEYLLDLYRREITSSGKDGWFDLNSLYRKQGLLPKDFNQKKMKQDLRKKAIANSKSDRKTVSSNGRVVPNKMDLNANASDKQKSGKIFSFKALLVKTIKVLFWFTIFAVVVYGVTLFQRVQKKKMRKTRVASRSSELL